MKTKTREIIEKKLATTKKYPVKAIDLYSDDMGFSYKTFSRYLLELEKENKVSTEVVSFGKSKGKYLMVTG